MKKLSLLVTAAALFTGMTPAMAADVIVTATIGSPGVSMT